MNNQNKPERFPCDDEQKEGVSIFGIHHTQEEWDKIQTIFKNFNKPRQSFNGKNLQEAFNQVGVLYVDNTEYKKSYNKAIEDCLAIARTADLEFKSRFLEEIENLKKK